MNTGDNSAATEAVVAIVKNMLGSTKEKAKGRCGRGRVRGRCNEDTCGFHARGNAAGTRVELTIDSGGGKSCAPKVLTRGYEIKPSAGSIAGQQFVGPGGERYMNEGKVVLDMVTESGGLCTGEFQVA